MRPSRGFTLVEQIVALCVFAVLAAFSIPSFGTWIADARMRNAAQALENGLRLARNEALARNRQALFALTHDAPSASATAVPNGRHWIVRALPALASGEADADGFVRGGDFGASGVSITGPAAVCFNAFGRLATNAEARCDSASELTYDITRPGAARRLRLQVRMAGGVRLCDPDKSLARGQLDGC